MSSIKMPTPKGFRDIKPEMAKARREIINIIVNVLGDSGFVPIDTPTIEFAEVLLGKYGEEADRLIYQFTDRGGRKLGLRYDLTVPLARYVATYNPALPFRRYQIGQVFRGENPQKGRWREFTQFDIDSVGSSSLQEDAKIIAVILASVKAVGLKNPVMAINDRKNFNNLSKEAVIALDKLDKIGDSGVISEMKEKGIKNAKEVLEEMKNKKPTSDLQTIFNYLKEMGIQGNEYEFVPTMARGLDYYTGSIFELRAPSYGNLSLGGGGRYDNLIGMFAKKDIPAVGFAIGLDRLIEALS